MNDISYQKNLFNEISLVINHSYFYKTINEKTFKDFILYIEQLTNQ